MSSCSTSFFDSFWLTKGPKPPKLGGRLIFVERERGTSVPCDLWPEKTLLVGKSFPWQMKCSKSIGEKHWTTLNFSSPDPKCRSRWSRSRPLPPRTAHPSTSTKTQCRNIKFCTAFSCTKTMQCSCWAKLWCNTYLLTVIWPICRRMTQTMHNDKKSRTSFANAERSLTAL